MKNKITKKKPVSMHFMSDIICSLCLMVAAYLPFLKVSK